MCVAVSAEILKLYEGGKMARVSVSGNELDVNVSLVSPKVGDFVLVHAGCAIEIVRREMAAEIMDLYRELEELMNDGH